MGNLRAGVSKVNITPYMGIWMAGFGTRSKGAEAVHDELYARAIVFDDGNEKLAMVTCDLAALDAESVESIRKMAQDMTGLKGENHVITPGSNSYTLFAVDNKDRKGIWSKKVPVRMRAMVKTAEKVFVAGPPDALKPEGARLLAFSASDGTELSGQQLRSPPVRDGLIAFNGCLYISLQDGTLLCLGK